MMTFTIKIVTWVRITRDTLIDINTNVALFFVTIYTVAFVTSGDISAN